MITGIILYWVWVLLALILDYVILYCVYYCDDEGNHTDKQAHTAGIYVPKESSSRKNCPTSGACSIGTASRYAQSLRPKHSTTQGVPTCASWQASYAVSSSPKKSSTIEVRLRPSSRRLSTESLNGNIINKSNYDREETMEAAAGRGDLPNE